MSSLVERIEGVIKEKGLNFKRVERDCGLGNGTIKRWAEQSPRLDKLILVSEYLNVSLDYLVFGSESETTLNGDRLCLDEFKQEQGLTCDGSPLSPIETDLVAMFRLLPPSHQEEIFNLIYFKYKQTVEKEKESIYWTYFDDSNPPAKRTDRDDKSASGIA